MRHPVHQATEFRGERLGRLPGDHLQALMHGQAGLDAPDDDV